MSIFYLYPTYRIKLVFFIIVSFYFWGCKGANKSHSPDQKVTRPIIETEQVAKLAQNAEKVITTTITQDVQWYGESCEKKESKLDLKEIIFLKVLDKNPSESLLNKLNQDLTDNQSFKAAKDGLAVFSKGLLMGYQDKKSQEKGYLISVSNLEFNTNSTATISLSQTKASLSAVDKTYQLSKKESNWEITACKVNSRG